MVKGPDICTNYVYAASRVAVLWYIAVIYPAGAGMHYYSQLYVQFGVMFTVMGEGVKRVKSYIRGVSQHLLNAKW